VERKPFEGKLRPVWLKNTPLLPQRVKSSSVSGLALLFEEPCPLSLQTVFSANRPSQSKNIYRWGKARVLSNHLAGAYLNRAEEFPKSCFFTEIRMFTSHGVYLTSAGWFDID
jgi:hypothetical protein